MEKDLLIVVLFSCCCLDFISAKVTITIKKYAFTNSAIKITCKLHQDTPLLTAMHLWATNESAVGGKPVRNRFTDSLLKLNRSGIPFIVKDGKLHSNPKTLWFVRFSLTNITCYDAQIYVCEASIGRVDFFANSNFLRVLEMPTAPRLSLIGNELCPETKDGCRDCQKESEKIPARKFGKIIQMECSTTVPRIGSHQFLWFYRDKQGKYHEITQNVTDYRGIRSRPSSRKHIPRRCVESRPTISRLDFTPDSFQHYGTKLTLRCNTTYSAPGTAEQIKNSSEIEICLLDTATTSFILVQTTPAEAKRITPRTGTTIVIVVTVSIAIVIVLIGVTYYRYKHTAMNRELDTIKGSKTSNAADISFTSLKSGGFSLSTASSNKSKNSRRKRGTGKKESTH